MKTKTCIVALLIASGVISSRAQDTWVKKADFSGTPTYAAVGFSIGSKGYVGTGSDASGLKRDFWEYDPSTNVWTQKADFGGTARNAAASFAIGSKGYVGTGADASGLKRDFWEYDPMTNAWTRKANFGGASRFGTVAFPIGSKGYVGTGINGSCCPFNLLKDIWEYDPATDTWTQKADFAGGLRGWAVGLSVGNKGYVGTGQSDNISKTLARDFWEFDPIADTWLQKADCGGNEREFAVGFSIDGKGYIGTGGNENVSSFKDVWEYDPIANTWKRKADFGGSARFYAKGFVIDGKGYIGTGTNELGTLYKDFWEYTPGESNNTCLQPPAGLVSWWSGDKTAADVQGINPFTLENGATFAAGKVNRAFALDGIDDSLSAADNDSLDPGTGDFTFEFWIQTTNSGAREAVLEKRPMCGAANFYQIKMNADGTIFSETMQDVNGTNFVTVTSTFPINDGVFHHVALTRQGVNVTLFIDGVQNATGSSPTTCNLSNAAPFIVGRTVCTGDRAFKGRIDELTYYTSALSPSAVQAIYTAGTAGKCKPEIFVSSITPSYEVVRHGFLISTSVVIQDENGIGVENALVQIKTILPSGSVLAFPVTTDAIGEALITFAASETGQYRFTVRKVTHSARDYDPSLNIETSDTLTIP